MTKIEEDFRTENAAVIAALEAEGWTVTTDVTRGGHVQLKISQRVEDRPYSASLRDTIAYSEAAQKLVLDNERNVNL